MSFLSNWQLKVVCNSKLPPEGFVYVTGLNSIVLSVTLNLTNEYFKKTDQRLFVADGEPWYVRLSSLWSSSASWRPGGYTRNSRTSRVDLAAATVRMKEMLAEKQRWHRSVSTIQCAPSRTDGWTETFRSVHPHISTWSDSSIRHRPTTKC